MNDEHAVMFIYPISSTLVSLKEIFQKADDDMNYQFYDVDDIAEASQLIRTINPIIVLTSDTKKCVHFLVENRKIVKKTGSKVILLSDRQTPQKILRKMLKLGLTEELIEPVNPKSIKYKVNLLLKSMTQATTKKQTQSSGSVTKIKSMTDASNEKTDNQQKLRVEKGIIGENKPEMKKVNVKNIDLQIEEEKAQDKNKDIEIGVSENNQKLKGDKDLLNNEDSSSKKNNKNFSLDIQNVNEEIAKNKKNDLDIAIDDSKEEKNKSASSNDLFEEISLKKKSKDDLFDLEETKTQKKKSALEDILTGDEEINKSSDGIGELDISAEDIIKKKRSEEELAIDDTGAENKNKNTLDDLLDASDISLKSKSNDNDLMDPTTEEKNTKNLDLDFENDLDITKKKKENVSELDIDEKKESQDSLLDDIQMKEQSKSSKSQDNLLDDIQVQKKKKELLEEINDKDFAKKNESSLDALAMLDEDEQIKLKEVEPLDILDKYEKKNKLEIEDGNDSADLNPLADINFLEDIKLNKKKKKKLDVEENVISLKKEKSDELNLDDEDKDINKLEIEDIEDNNKNKKDDLSLDIDSSDISLSKKSKDEITEVTDSKKSKTDLNIEEISLKKEKKEEELEEIDIKEKKSDNLEIEDSSDKNNDNQKTEVIDLDFKKQKENVINLDDEKKKKGKDEEFSLNKKTVEDTKVELEKKQKSEDLFNNLSSGEFKDEKEKEIKNKESTTFLYEEEEYIPEAEIEDEEEYIEPEIYSLDSNVIILNKLLSDEKKSFRIIENQVQKIDQKFNTSTSILCGRSGTSELFDVYTGHFNLNSITSTLPDYRIDTESNSKSDLKKWENHKKSNLHFWRRTSLPTWKDETFQDKQNEFIFPFYEGTHLLGLTITNCKDQITQETSKQIESVIESFRGILISEYYEVPPETQSLKKEQQDLKNQGIVGKIGSFFKNIFGRAS